MKEYHILKSTVKYMRSKMYTCFYGKTRTSELSISVGNPLSLGTKNNHYHITQRHS